MTLSRIVATLREMTLGTMNLSIPTASIMIFNIITIILMAHSGIMTLSDIMTLSIMKLGVMAQGIMTIKMVEIRIMAFSQMTLNKICHPA